MACVKNILGLLRSIGAVVRRAETFAGPTMTGKEAVAIPPEGGEKKKDAKGKKKELKPEYDLVRVCSGVPAALAAHTEGRCVARACCSRQRI